MFENLSKREKILAAVVGSLAPLVVVFLVFIGFMDQYDSRRREIRNLQQQITAENNKRLEAAQANLRRNYFYRAKSLPSDYSPAIIDYRDWLEKLIRDSGLSFLGIKDPEATQIKYKESRTGISKVADKFEYSFSTRGELEQAIQFIYEFESLDLLHKIESVSVKPVTSKNRILEEKVFTFKIEVLSLVDAEEERDFLARRRELPFTLAEYRQQIGENSPWDLPNEEPSFSPPRKSFYVGETINISLSARDSNDDQLTYELVDNGGLEGLVLEHEEGSTRATLNCPEQEPGEYEFTVRVTDDGLPPKSVEKTCQFVVKEKPVRREPEPEPKIAHASKAQINRISSTNGVFEAKIRVRTTGESFELSNGDEFELDDKKWIVREINIHSLTMEVDGQLLKFRQGAFLDQGQETKGQAKTADASADST